MTDNTAPKDEYDYSVGHMTFEPVPFDFDSLPTNDEAARDARRAMPVFRMAAVMTRFGDKELEQIVRQEPEANLELLECIASHIQITKNRLQILEQAFCRLNVVLERYASRGEQLASKLQEMRSGAPGNWRPSFLWPKAVAPAEGCGRVVFRRRPLSSQPKDARLATGASRNGGVGTQRPAPLFYNRASTSPA